MCYCKVKNVKYEKKNKNSAAGRERMSENQENPGLQSQNLRLSQESEEWFNGVKENKD